MTAAGIVWETVLVAHRQSATKAPWPPQIRRRVGRVERQLRHLADNMPMSSLRLFALMCIADSASMNAHGHTVTGIEWGYAGWSPYPKGVHHRRTGLTLRERHTSRAIVRQVWRDHGEQPIDDLAAVARQALDRISISA